LAGVVVAVKAALIVASDSDGSKIVTLAPNGLGTAAAFVGADVHGLAPVAADADETLIANIAATSIPAASADRVSQRFDSCPTRLRRRTMAIPLLCSTLSPVL
jgi:hypothetical protein